MPPEDVNVSAVDRPPATRGWWRGYISGATGGPVMSHGGAPYIYRAHPLAKFRHLGGHWWAGNVSRGRPLHFTARPFGKISKKWPAHRKIRFFRQRGKKFFFSRAGERSTRWKERNPTSLSFLHRRPLPAREKKNFFTLWRKKRNFSVGGRLFRNFAKGSRCKIQGERP